MNPADTLTNLFIAATPGGIEAQEKRGQMQQATQQTLPLDLGGDRALFEQAGFVFGDPADDLFQHATFPEGWSKRPTEHSMWSDIVDEKGRKRGAIFYKAAFYDRSAHARLTRRFSTGQTFDGPRKVYVRDQCGEVTHEIAVPETDGLKGREERLRAYEAIDAAEKQVRDWLSEHYPDWHSPLAYWI